MCCPSGERKMTDNISTPTQQDSMFAFLRLEPAFTFIITPVSTCGQADTLDIFFLCSIDVDLRTRMLSDATNSGAPFLGPC